MSFDLSNPSRPVHVGVVLMGAETEILDVAPVDLLHTLDRKVMQDIPLPDSIKDQAMDFVFHWVNEGGGDARLTSGITMKCTDSFSTCPPLDIVVMGQRKQGYAENEAELAFIRKTFDDCSAFLAICGGFESAHRAGLLKGKTATAPRVILDMLRKESPETDWVEKRWARHGKMWTSGILLNGLDLMMAFARDTWPHKADIVEMLLDIGGWPVRNVDY